MQGKGIAFAVEDIWKEMDMNAEMKITCVSILAGTTWYILDPGVEWSKLLAGAIMMTAGFINGVISERE